MGAETAADRQRRLAEALRVNLKRRKSQARGRAASSLMDAASMANAEAQVDAGQADDTLADRMPEAGKQNRSSPVGE